ncbi:hypothetical protein EIN_164630 [Entamoeba invadens IP1]|uniref:Reverse transcriptase zinc-binding domain-containing protein n=1 Tax=Entamoeba invadens IP1 TaxID=370355 RepID=A0A0A1U482_ENTIV|nr:hypothetical protein EIN_164630 [Entamoeba invadens IP1]ELP89043.1 hypothetical protein EIN_164630 [Entamoeba invadens IP1]|eukprot:XP_004255814.1 hypothetical protein EIN_164630 [Entamoeba invadens IP1]
MLDINNVDLEITGQAWSNLNIKCGAYKQIVTCQENGYIIGERKSAISGIESDKYCKYCQFVNSVDHILLSCKAHKKSQIERHDCIVEEMWRAIMIKYDQIYVGNEDIVELPEGGKAWKGKEMMFRIDGKYPKKPDITWKVGKEKAYIIDITIVANKNLSLAFFGKIKKYMELREKLRKCWDINNIKIVPVVITTGGLINKYSVQKIKEMGLQLKWEKIVRNLLCQQMIEIMKRFYQDDFKF